MAEQIFNGIHFWSLHKCNEAEVIWTNQWQVPLRDVIKLLNSSGGYDILLLASSSIDVSLLHWEIRQVFSYSARCLLVLDCSALYDWATQNTSPMEGIHVSRYSCDDWVRYAWGENKGFKDWLTDFDMTTQNTPTMEVIYPRGWFNDWLIIWLFVKTQNASLMAGIQICDDWVR